MMKINNYSFTSVHYIEKNSEEVWRKLIDVKSWPRIWKYFRSVEIDGDENIPVVGSTIHCKVRAAMFYQLDFFVIIEEIIPYEKLNVTCHGDLAGEGTWLLKGDGDSVESVFVWEVKADSFLLKIIGILPFGMRILRFNHKLVMDEGYRSFLKE